MTLSMETLEALDHSATWSKDSQVIVIPVVEARSLIQMAKDSIRLRDAALIGLDSTVAWLNEFERSPNERLRAMYERRRKKILAALSDPTCLEKGGEE